MPAWKIAASAEKIVLEAISVGCAAVEQGPHCIQVASLAAAVLKAVSPLPTSEVHGGTLR